MSAERAPPAPPAPDPHHQSGAGVQNMGTSVGATTCTTDIFLRVERVIFDDVPDTFENGINTGPAPDPLQSEPAHFDTRAAYRCALQLGLLVVCRECKHFSARTGQQPNGSCTIHGETWAAVPFDCPDYLP